MRLQFRLARFSKMLTYQTIVLDQNFWNTTFNLLPPQPPQTKRTYTASNGLKVTMHPTSPSDISHVVLNTEMIFGRQGNSTSLSFADDTTRDSTFDKIVSALKELCIFGINNGVISQVCTFCINFLERQNQYCSWIMIPSSEFNPDTDKCSHFNSINNDTRKFEFHVVR